MAHIACEPNSVYPVVQIKPGLIIPHSFLPQRAGYRAIAVYCKDGITVDSGEHIEINLGIKISLMTKYPPTLPWPTGFFQVDRFLRDRFKVVEVSAMDGWLGLAIENETSRTETWPADSPVGEFVINDSRNFIIKEVLFSKV